MATAKMRKLENSNESNENNAQEGVTMAADEIQSTANEAMRSTVDKAAEISREFPLFDAARMMGWPVEIWLRAQSGMLKAVQPVATGWIERRRDAATAALDAIEKLSHCNDLQEAAAIQRDWFEGTMRRFDTDLHAMADQAVALSQEAMSATRYAAQTSSEVVGRTMQATTTRTEHTIEQAA
jgi:hypothetical protein